MLMRYIRVKEANCKNCYKCLKHCAVKSISYINDRVEVIEDGCIDLTDAPKSLLIL